MFLGIRLKQTQIVTINSGLLWFMQTGPWGTGREKALDTRGNPSQAPSGNVFREASVLGLPAYTIPKLNLGARSMYGVLFRKFYLFRAAWQSLSTASLCSSTSLHLAVLATLLPSGSFKTLGWMPPDPISWVSLPMGPERWGAQHSFLKTLCLFVGPAI